MGITGKFALGVQNEVRQRLTEFCQENTLVIANTLLQQHKRWLYTWTSPDGQYQNQIDYVLCSRRWKSSTQSTKIRSKSWLWLRSQTPYCKIQIKLKKVGKTSRPFRYDLRQIPYDFTVEVKNRFKGLHLIECLKNCRQRFVTLYRRQGPKPSQRKRNASRQNDNLKALQIPEERSDRQRRKGKIYPSKCRAPKKSKKR